MKHIREIIALRKEQLGLARIRQQLSLFAAPPEREKGSREWELFSPVAHDHADAYRVITPRRHEEPRYPNIVHITRYPRHLTPRIAR